jgi:glutaminase
MGDTARTSRARSRASIPRSPRCRPDLFGICVVGATGAVYAVGNAEHEFTIMSVSKPFVFALDEKVLASASATNARNQGVARLLQSFDRLYCDPVEAVDLYTRQCSLRVTARNLAVFAPRLDAAGNSVRGQLVARFLSEQLGMDLLISRPAP